MIIALRTRCKETELFQTSWYLQKGDEAETTIDNAVVDKNTLFDERSIRNLPLSVKQNSDA